MIAAKSIKEIHRFESSDTKSISSIFEENDDLKWLLQHDCEIPKNDDKLKQIRHIG